MKNLDSSLMKILVCCHKPCVLPKDDIFLPIQVGAAISNIDLGIQRDDQINGNDCNNISVKNKSYCELTAMYWAWKNVKTLYPNLEYIGLNHYRRLFSFEENLLFDDAIVKKEEDLKKYVINYKKLFSLLSKKDIIVSKKHFYPYPIYVDYSLGHISDDFRILKKVVHDLYPEYDQAFYDIIFRQNGIAHYNMFIMKFNYFNEYCKWLFDILFECEKRIDISKYNPVQGRIWGYMAERLFNVWLCNNYKKRLAYLNVYKYDDNSVSKKLLKRFVLKVSSSISTKIIRPKSKCQRASSIELENKYLRTINQ